MKLESCTFVEIAFWEEVRRDLPHHFSRSTPILFAREHYQEVPYGHCQYRLDKMSEYNKLGSEILSLD